jgi:hypothetical protein
MNVLSILQSETPLTLVRETLWRTRRRWKQLRLPALTARNGFEVHYRRAGYYDPKLEGLSKTARQAILDYASLIANGKFSCFGYTAALGLPPLWSFDFVSEKDWPQAPSGSLTVVRHDGSDVKVPWELSRLQFLPVLGKAWRLTSDARVRECSKGLLSDWIQKNPVNLGVNWTVAMEAALRAISICFLLELLSPFSSAEQAWLQTVTRSLWEHLLFIEAHNEFSYLARSNHYLSNLAGLYCLSVYLDGPGMDARCLRYSRLLEREITHQVNEDGVDYEASVGYHVLVAQLLTVCLRLMRTSGTEPSAQFVDRLRKMYQYIAALANRRGELPQVGDCDDGRVELLLDDVEPAVGAVKPRNSLTVSGLLGIGGFLLGEDFGGCGDDACWLGAEYRRQSFAPSGEDPRIFPVSGIGTVRRAGSDLFFFAMPNGIGGKGSHTHNDKLSLILRVEGHELLTDSGTFCYTRDAGRRNWFRSTLAHNTLRIDQQEQNRFSEARDNLFRMQNDAAVGPIRVNDNVTCTQLCAEHQGYARLGMIHGRCVSLSDASQALVEDNVSGSGKHLIEANWHLPSLWRAEIEPENGKEVLCKVRGPLEVEMKFCSSVPLRVASAPVAISTSYGASADGTVLTVTANTELPFRLSTRISWAHV